jgi:hypothetical protein
MAGSRFFFRLTGILWLLFGLTIFGISIAFMLLFEAVNAMILAQAPELSSILSPLLSRFSPGVQQVAGTLFGSFCLFIGVGLVSLRTWARTVGIVFNITMGACLAVLTLTLYVYMTTPGLLSMVIPSNWPTYEVIIGAVLAVGLMVTGFLLSMPWAMDAFSGFTPVLPPLPPVKCPTCGGVLDLEKGRCPHCDAEVPPRPRAPV